MTDQIQPTPDTPTPDAAPVLRVSDVVKMIEDTGRFALDAANRTPTEGYAVRIPSYESMRIPWPERPAIQFRIVDMSMQFGGYMSALSVLAGDKRLPILGGWLDKDNFLVIEIAEMFADRNEAIAAGNDRDQDCIWDFAAGDSIPLT